MSTTRPLDNNLTHPLRQEEQPSKLSRPCPTSRCGPIAAYTCYKPTPIRTSTNWNRKQTVNGISLCRRLQTSFPSYRIGRVPYSYHSSVSGTFNSLFKVLCTFPSLYLFAIGLRAIFSLSRGTPADLFSTPKLNDSCRLKAW